MTKKDKNGSPRFIVPPNKLKEKVGDGGIPAHLLLKAQKAIDSNTEDFKPYANEFLGKLTHYVEHANENMSAARADDLAALVMQLKANGAMFKYDLISMVADVVLRFLENVTVIDRDVLDIIRMHNNILTVILKKDFVGNGGKQGALLTAELNNACARYYKKHGIQTT